MSDTLHRDSDQVSDQVSDPTTTPMTTTPPEQPTPDTPATPATSATSATSATPDTPSTSTSGDGGPGGSGPGRQGRRSGPGWFGTVAVGASAAVVASLLTAGIVARQDDDTTSTSTVTTTASAPAVRAPVTGSSADSPDWGAVAAAVEPSVVAVLVNDQNGSGQGSGVLIDDRGRILTNNHVVSGAGQGSTVSVVLNDGRTYPATVVGTDPSTDLAVIALTNPPDDLTPATLGDSAAVEVGDPVMAVGNPLGLAGTVTTGIVSATDRPSTTSAQSDDPTATGGETVVTNAIQTDAAINPGNSGGALVDAQGRVVGIPSSIASLGGSNPFGQSGSIGLGFAIPINEAKDVSQQLIDGGTVSHAWLGVGPDDGTVTVDGATRSAAILRDIVPGGPAEKAGLKAGDSVVAVDGEPVNSAVSLVGQLRERRAGTEVSLTLVRDGKSSDVRVTLGTRPATP